MKPLFVFDLDSTITRCELLPLIACSIGTEDEMARITEQAMAGAAAFADSFSMRVDRLKGVPVSQARRIAAAAPLHEEIARFIMENPDHCRIVTGNLDVWIEDLIARLGMQGRCLCSQARVDQDRLLGIDHIMDKNQAAARLPHPFVAIGDGDNDLGLLQQANIGVAFSGARTISDRLRRAADCVFDDESALVHYLKTLLEQDMESE